MPGDREVRNGVSRRNTLRQSPQERKWGMAIDAKGRRNGPVVNFIAPK